MQVLIIGDSFAADWSAKYSNYLGWPTLLAQKYNVTNLAQAGVSEYKILKQILSVDNPAIFDLIIVSHTSPYRIHTRCHPVHVGDALHHSADLIYADVEYHYNTLPGFFNRALRAAMQYYRWHYDEEYYESMYYLLREKINSSIGFVPIITINNFPTELQYTFDAQRIRQEHPGVINHMSEVGNLIVYNTIVDEINAISN